MRLGTLLFCLAAVALLLTPMKIYCENCDVGPYSTPHALSIHQGIAKCKPKIRYKVVNQRDKKRKREKSIEKNKHKKPRIENEEQSSAISADVSQDFLTQSPLSVRSLRELLYSMLRWSSVALEFAKTQSDTMRSYLHALSACRNISKNHPLLHRLALLLIPACLLLHLYPRHLHLNQSQCL
jgi:hypothetical protein